jgi:GNAT superfamily N-acetyltransferase
MAGTDISGSVVPLPVTQPLTSSDAASGFECEHEALNRFFRQEAGQNQRRDMSRTWILRRPEDQPDLPRILGYYTLTVGTVERASLPEGMIRRLPRYPIPAVVIGRLARHLRVKGQGYGEVLLDDAHRRALHVSTQVGAAVLVVDAKDPRAYDFYRGFGYELLLMSAPDAELWPRRLFLPMATLRKSFEVS